MRVRLLVSAMLLAACGSVVSAQTPDRGGVLGSPALPPEAAATLEQLLGPLRAILGSSMLAGSLPGLDGGVEGLRGLEGLQGLDGLKGLEGLLGPKSEPGARGTRVGERLGQPVDGPFSRSGDGPVVQSFRRDDHVAGAAARSSDPAAGVIWSGMQPRFLVEAARTAARQQCMKEPDEKKRAACLLDADQK